MSTTTETSDSQLLDLLRRSGGMSVAELADATDVTATAVRQRLTRLMGQGLVERSVSRSGRGRPSHTYTATDKARRRAGSNFTDLVLVLWEEVRAIDDPEVRRGLLKRLADRMVELYRDRVDGDALAERMESLKDLFDERDVGLEIDETDDGTVLRVLDCPYTELAEQDRGICAVEKMLFSELLDDNVRLAECRLDGYACCQFESN